MVNIIESITVGLFHNVLGFGHIYYNFPLIFLFFLIKYLIILSAVMVVISVNAIYSVFFLIFLFINVAILTVALGVEFLGITFIIVDVGAIAVLFLFVVMMLNINKSEINISKSPSFFLYFFFTFILLLAFSKYLATAIYGNFGFGGLPSQDSFLTVFYSFQYRDWTNFIFKADNIIVLGTLLYTYYFHLFILVGFILLLAMVSSIVLTLNYTTSAKSQNKYIQITRQLNRAIQIRY